MGPSVTSCVYLQIKGRKGDIGLYYIILVWYPKFYNYLILTNILSNGGKTLRYFNVLKLELAIQIRPIFGQSWNPKSESGIHFLIADLDSC